MRLRAFALVGLLLGAAVVGAAPAAADQTATIDAGSFPLHADDRQVVSGETTLSPGSELTVRLRSNNASNPFLKQDTTRVLQNGTFAATFDMSPVPANTSVNLVVHSDGETLVERDTRVVACDGNCSDPAPPTPASTPTPTETDWEGSGLDVRRVTAVEQGATATIPLSMEGVEVATVSIGGPDVNYVINATVRDGDADGEARVLFNTSNAGTDGATLAIADSDDDLTVTNDEPALPSTLDPAPYDIRLYEGTGTAGQPAAVGTLSITDDGTNDTQYNVSEGPEFGFERSIVRTRQGETARIAISLRSADAATVSIGGPESGYEINGTVRDGDGDGRVTLLFDTAAAGHDGTTLSTAGTADNVTVEPGSEVALDTRLDAGDYDLSLARGTDIGADVDDIGTLVVQPSGDEATPTATQTAALSDADTSSSPSGRDLGAGVGSLAVGGILATAAAVLLFRSVVG
ncbi:BGTF surface domain-containing protein [Halomicroarcula sp. GCM10025817]|uniref:DUF7827 domain-containing protein n=1 Tax=Haloarcula TaxID=2237 RepID=UPI0023E8D6CD|nr:BGTF surface domain-containing protein [Halomicroarcula sp. SYNS111]